LPLIWSIWGKYSPLLAKVQAQEEGGKKQEAQTTGCLNKQNVGRKIKEVKY